MAAQGGMSRVSSQTIPRLPQIQHPLSRLGDPETISVRGFSRTGDRREAEQPNEQPEGGEARDPLPSSRRKGQREREVERSGRGSLQHIPEGVEVTVGTEPNKPRLPVFGQRADLDNRTESRISQSSRSINTSRPGTHLRIEIDELEYVLREKMKSAGYFAIKQLFKANDPEGRGQVNRDILLMMVTKFLGRFISSKQFQQLLLRFKLHDKITVKYEEFYAAVRDPITPGAPMWLDPIHRHSDRMLMTASQVHSQLKERARQRFPDLTQILPQKNPEGTVRLLGPEFRSLLHQLGYQMEDEEFKKLCKRYDTDGLGFIKEDVLMRKLRTANSENSDRKSWEQMSLEDSARPPRILSKAEHERRTSLDIEKWLKNKFREGYKLMKEKFEKYDVKQTGKVMPQDFLSVLEKFDLHLKDEHFNLFLARCNLQNSKCGIDYTKFLKNFQDRSENGLPHKIMSNPKHRFNQEGSPSLCTTLTAIEAKLTRLFQSDFLSLLATFHKIDKLDRNVISQQEFQAAIESRFGVEITDEEFELLIDRIPLDEDGNVQYPQFMAIFDSRKGVSSLFEDTSGILSRRHTLHENQFSAHFDEDSEHGRSPGQLFGIIKTLLNKQYQEVERQFEELDEINSRRLNHETMYRLLKRFKVWPEVTRGEIRRLWETLITNQDKTLDFLEFVRHFGHSPKSACFPNAKISPPRKGDSDFRMCSKNLNCASDIIVDSVRAKVDYMWEDLSKEFQQLDPYHTGFVSQEEFKDILTELCVHLNEYECGELAKKFEINGDGRSDLLMNLPFDAAPHQIIETSQSAEAEYIVKVSYVEFLKPFATRRQSWREGSNMIAVMQHPQARSTIQPPGSQKIGLHSVTARLRHQLKGEWKPLRRAFKKLDSKNSGYLSLPEFRAVLKLCNFLLNEEEVYQIMSKFDESLEGKIDYRKFLEETYRKKQTRQKGSRSSPELIRLSDGVGNSNE